MKLSAPIYLLKQRAKALARANAIPLHEALDRIARMEGFRAWSMLSAATSSSNSEVASLAARVRAGDLLLLGARPRQGKTLLALGLAIETMRTGNRAALFTLEFSRADVARCFSALNEDLGSFDDRFYVDESDLISADYVMAKMASAPRNTLIVIDYLQLLDQRRSNPDLPQQIRALKSFVRERGHIALCLAQIDRRYDPAVSKCPGLADVRLPNPLDLTLFDKACFLNAGAITYT
jgi:replicative DNA helicase